MAFSGFLEGLAKAARAGEEVGHLGAPAKALSRSVEKAGSVAAHSGENSLLRRIGLQVANVETPNGPLRVSFMGGDFSEKSREMMLSHIRDLVADSPDTTKSLKRIRVITDYGQDSSIRPFMEELTQRKMGNNVGKFNASKTSGKIILQGPHHKELLGNVQSVLGELQNEKVGTEYYRNLMNTIKRVKSYGPMERQTLKPGTDIAELMNRTLTHEWGHALHFQTSEFETPLHGLNLARRRDFLPKGFSTYAEQKFNEQQGLAHFQKRYQKELTKEIKSIKPDDWRQTWKKAHIESSYEKQWMHHIASHEEPIAELYAAAFHEPEIISPETFAALDETFSGKSRRVAQLAKGRHSTARSGLPAHSLSVQRIQDLPRQLGG